MQAATNLNGQMPEKVHKQYRSKLEWLPAKAISISAKGQRGFDEKHSAKLAANFDPDLLGYPFVWAQPIGRDREQYFAIDGYHRIRALMEWGGENQQIECEVVRGITEERAAKLFRGRNTRRGVLPIDLFLTGLTAKEPECLAVMAILTAEHLRVTRATGSKDGIAAVSALLTIYRKDSTGILLRKVLRTCKEAWGNSADSFNGDLLRGMAAFFYRYGTEIDEPGFRNKLRAVSGGALGLLGKARAVREGFSTTITEAVARALVGLYNKGRGVTLLAEWGTK